MQAHHDVIDTAIVYDLVVHDGRPALRFVFKDRGVAVDATALRIVQNGQWKTIPLAEIRAIALRLVSTGASGVVGICDITLRTGQRIVVSTMAPSGFADPSRTDIYRRFVAQLHKQLVASGAAGQIGFSQGFSPARRAVLLVGLIAGAVLFVAGPLLALALARDLKALLLVFAGAGLMVPFWRVYNRNAPRNYLPTNPPDLLL